MVRRKARPTLHSRACITLQRCWTPPQFKGSHTDLPNLADPESTQRSITLRARFSFKALIGFTGLTKLAKDVGSFLG